MPQLAVFDFETDPFDGVSLVKPFCVGFYDGSTYDYDWSQNTVEWIVAKIRDLPSGSICYAHNGGCFDFFFMLDDFDGKLRIANRRILEGTIGNTVVRDSWGIFPLPLATHDKGKVDYSIMKSSDRDKPANRRVILEYLKRDCVALYDVVSEFHNEFGNRLTIGGTALKALKKIHPFQSLSDYNGSKNKGASKAFDRQCREFYYGGRNQCFKTGVIYGDYKIYDVNSMYPFVMSTFRHPVSPRMPTIVEAISERSGFVCVNGYSRGALPVRTKTGIDFPYGPGTFKCTIHELNAGIETGTFDLESVNYALDFDDWSTFGSFVDLYYSKRLDCRALAKTAQTDKEARFHKLRETFFKTILNSSYGRFALNPDNFRDWEITPVAEHPKARYDDQKRTWIKWDLEQETAGFRLWSTASRDEEYVNVATAASITGAARATLLRGLAKAHDPIYCDTDSIICLDLDCDLSASNLGGWKLEGKGRRVSIAGKKLYSVFSEYDNTSDLPKGSILTDAQKNTLKNGGSIEIASKFASKGAKLSATEIDNIAQGDAVRYSALAPAFKLNGKHSFVHRNIKATGVAGKIG